MRYVQLDYFVVSETKLENCFPSTQFILSDYQVGRDGMWIKMAVVLSNKSKEVSLAKD